MERKLKHLDIVFENCESVRLKPDMFTRLIVEGVKPAYSINCFQYSKGEVHDSTHCENFSIIINKKGLQQKTEMGTDIKIDSLEKRLRRFNDITHIHLYFSDKTDQYIAVPWGGEYMENEKQTVASRKEEMEINIF